MEQVELGRPRELWLLRHAATEWSENGRHTGCRSDIPLTEGGREAARALRSITGEIKFDAIFVSPLSRTRETAALAGLEEGAILEPNLREWDYGDLEGITTSEIRHQYPGWTIWSGPVPGGESASEVGRRAHDVIQRTAAYSGRVAIVSHGHFSRVLAATWLGLPPERGASLRLDTGTYSVLGWEHEYPTILRWNAPVVLRG